MTVRIFEVGGTIRDRFLGLENKDRDFAVEAESWEAMQAHVHSIATKVFLEKPEFVTIRALVPDEETGKPDARDFVLCRKDGPSSDGRHPDWVEVGTIFDDLARRDFTVNAMAVDLATGEVIDPHNGQRDLELGVLRCVGNTEARMTEDALRILRAMRFSLTKELMMDDSLDEVFSTQGHKWAPHLANVSTERIREELRKCFAWNTVESMEFLCGISPTLRDAIFRNGLWLEPTLKEK